MGSLISFTSNYQDRSADNGYQFEFFCDSCGNGYTSHFKESKLGLASGIMKAAGGFFGHVGSEVGHGAHQVNDLMRGSHRDEALRDAVNEAKKVFKQCSRCGNWVCPEVCWNTKTSQCIKCSPNLAKEFDAAVATGQKEQIWRQARDSSMISKTMGGFNLSNPDNPAAAPTGEATTTCGACGAANQSGKFCQECGKPLATKKFCPGCGVEAAATARFCGGCGGKLG